MNGIVAFGHKKLDIHLRAGDRADWTLSKKIIFVPVWGNVVPVDIG
jgi:hypothetical protein